MADKKQETVDSSKPETSENVNPTNILVCCALGRCVVQTNLKKCGGCGLVAYCCRDHQVEHYKDGHKLICPGREKGKPLTFNECFEKATNYYQEGKWNAALMYYSAMLELTERSAGVFHIQNANCLDVIALCYRHQNKMENAIQCLQRELVIKQIHNDGSDAKNKDDVNLLGKLAEYYIIAEQTELAKQCLTKMIEEIKTTFGDDSFELGKAFCSLAVCHDKLDEITDAEQVLLQACEISKYKNASGSYDDILLASNAFENLGLIYIQQNKFSEALKSLQKAYDMRIKGKLPIEHPEMILLKTKMEEIENSNGSNNNSS